MSILNDKMVPVCRQVEILNWTDCN